MRIPSGKVDQKIFFVAVNPDDLKTRIPGLSSFVVVRSRNGGTTAVYSTPTVTELGTNMPGVYCLLIDEDTTIETTSESEEYCVHITSDTAGSPSVSAMAPVTRTVELYRDNMDKVVEGTRTLRQVLRGFSAALLAKVSGMATNAPVFRDIDDSKNRISATTDQYGNRSAVTLDLT